MIRPADKTDSAAIVTLVIAAALFDANDSAIVDAMLVDYFAGDIDNGHACVVDETENELIGVAYYQPDAATDRIWDLTLIAIRPDRQREGCGGHSCAMSSRPFEPSTNDCFSSKPQVTRPTTAPGRSTSHADTTKKPGFVASGVTATT